MFFSSFYFYSAKYYDLGLPLALLGSGCVVARCSLGPAGLSLCFSPWVCGFAAPLSIPQPTALRAFSGGFAAFWDLNCSRSRLPFFPSWPQRPLLDKIGSWSQSFALSWAKAPSGLAAIAFADKLLPIGSC